MVTPINVAPLKPNIDNATFLNAIRRHASPAFQERVPESTQANVQQNLNDLANYRPTWNEFQEALVNRIGLEIYRYNNFTNPLGKYKRGYLEAGDTIEEVITGLVEADVYDTDREALESTLFGTHGVESRSFFHKINRQNVYTITINEALLKRAFLTSSGLGSFVTQLMAVPSTSDQWDEFLIMSSLLRTMDDDGAFFNINVGDIANITDDNGAAAKYALRKMREMASTLPFISRKYNPAGMPLAVQPDDLELITTPGALAAMDVEALAGAFNINKAEFAARTTVIPEENFNIPGAQAIITSRDFFVAADSLLETTSQWNPAKLQTNYFLHHHGVYSASPAAPAILFSTRPSTPIVLDEYVVTGVNAITLTDEDGNTVTNVERGEFTQLDSSVITSPTGGSGSIRYVLSGALSVHTRISRTGVLFVAADEQSESLTVTAIAVDSPDKTNPVQVSQAFTVVGDLLIAWPNPEVIPDADEDGLLEVTPAPIVKDASNNVTIPTVVGVQYQEDGTNVANGTVIAITGSHTFTAVSRAGYELAAGAVASWTIS